MKYLYWFLSLIPVYISLVVFADIYPHPDFWPMFLSTFFVFASFQIYEDVWSANFGDKLKIERLNDTIEKLNKEIIDP